MEIDCTFYKMQLFSFTQASERRCWSTWSGSPLAPWVCHFDFSKRLPCLLHNVSIRRTEKHKKYGLGKLCRSSEEARLKESYSWAAAKPEKSPVKEDRSIHFLLITFVFLLFFCSHYMSVSFLNSSMLSLRQMVWSHVVAWNPQRIAGTCRKGSDDAVLSQLMQLQVIEGLPGTNDGDIWNTEDGNRCSNSDLRLMNQEMCGEWTHLFLNPPFLGYHHQSCRETKLLDIITLLVSEPVKQRRATHPWTPFFGGLLLNWRVCLCLNLGGPLRGVAGPPLTRVADLISALGSRFILPVAFVDAPRVCGQVVFTFWKGEKRKCPWNETI